MGPVPIDPVNKQAAQGAQGCRKSDNWPVRGTLAGDPSELLWGSSRTREAAGRRLRGVGQVLVIDG